MRRNIVLIFSVISFAALGWFLGSEGRLKNPSFFVPSSEGAAFAQEEGQSKVVFKVKCYDDGKTALQGLKGITRIETGFHYLHETDTVYFDPTMITVEEMEAALKKAGTFVETLH